MSLYRIHRPITFSDLIGQDHIRDTLLEAVKQDMLSHAYLFTGPRGTGKTTTARLIAKVANCLNIEKNTGEPCNKCESCSEISDLKSMDIIEIDAASNRGIDEIRELRENVKFSPTKLKYKVYIIDEVHMLTREAFNALLKTLEEPPNHAIFILATTEPHKIPATIISRTQRFDFRRISKKDIVTNLKLIAKKEKIEIDDDSLDLIATTAQGGHRDAISLLDQASSFKKKLNLTDVENILGIASEVEVMNMLEAIFSTNPEEGLKIAQNLYKEGISLAQFNVHIIETLRKLLLYVSSNEVLFEDTKENTEQIKEFSKKYFPEKDRINSTKKLVSLIEIFIEAGRLIKDVSYPVLPIEMAVIESTGLNETNKQKNEEITAFCGTPPKAVANSNDQKPKIIKEEKDSHSVLDTESRDDRILNQVQDDTKNNIDLKKPEAQKANVAPEALEDSPELPTFVNLESFSEDIWQKVINETKAENSTLAALLRDTKPVGAEAENLIVGVKFKFHQDKISEAKNISILEGVIHKVSGQNVRVKCQIADLRRKPTVSSSDDDLQKAAKEIFND